jgi:hypothetical protein
LRLYKTLAVRQEGGQIRSIYLQKKDSKMFLKESQCGNYFSALPPGKYICK